MNKSIRRSALFLAVAMLFLSLFSFIFIAAESEHDCTGEHCSVCCQIRDCENTLKTAAVTAAAVFALLVCRCGDYSLSPLPFFGEICATPITLKVKLSD